MDIYAAHTVYPLRDIYMPLSTCLSKGAIVVRVNLQTAKAMQHACKRPMALAANCLENLVNVCVRTRAHVTQPMYSVHVVVVARVAKRVVLLRLDIHAAMTVQPRCYVLVTVGTCQPEWQVVVYVNVYVAQAGKPVRKGLVAIAANLAE
jgi:hypothetical protein